MNYLLIKLIRFYQITLSAFLGQHCRFSPTCSNYAIEALQRHGVVKGTTSLPPMTLLSVTQTIEKELGRTNKNTGQSRVIDIDILLYNDLIMANDQLIIPHPLLHERYFVLRPLNDISSHFIHPVFNQSIRDLWRQYQNQSIDTLSNPNE